MSTITPTRPPGAGWYPDPENQSRLRFWDGSNWTDNFATGPITQKPHQPSRLKTGFVVMAVIAVLLAATLTAVVVRSNGNGTVPGLTSNSVNVVYGITLIGTSCGHSGDPYDGYQDIDVGTQVEVTDGSGTVLGYGTLGAGSSSSDGCAYSSTFDVKKSPDGIYRTTAGSVNRGYLNYSQSDVVNGTLPVDAALG